MTVTADYSRAMGFAARRLKGRMIMKRETAEELSKTVFGCSSTLERSVSLFKDKLEPAEFERYRRTVAEVITTIVHDILEPIYTEYPDLRPY